MAHVLGLLLKQALIQQLAPVDEVLEVLLELAACGVAVGLALEDHGLELPLGLVEGAVPLAHGGDGQLVPLLELLILLLLLHLWFLGGGAAAAAGDVLGHLLLEVLAQVLCELLLVGGG